MVKIYPWFASVKTCPGCGHKVETAPQRPYLGLLKLRHKGD
ncbi:hypothetical protein [Vreelandella massiliensis]